MEQQITLYFKSGSSDKVYQVSLKPSGDGYTVDYANGRRGKPLKGGTKTASPVTLENAQSIYDNLVRSKQAKGYTADTSGAAFVGSEKADQVSGIVCQLLNRIDEAEAIALCHNPDYCAQEKFNGDRQLIQRADDKIHGINKKGLYTGLSEALVTAALKLPASQFDVDGEGLGDTNRAFDLLTLNHEDLRPLPYIERYKRLKALANDVETQSAIIPVETAFTTEEKLALLEEVKARHGEGLVFKRLDAPHTAGRPASGGDQFKYKFYETCSVIVAALNDGKRSVAIALFDNGEKTPVGNVTIAPNKPIPSPGQVVEIRYLHAYRGGSLYEPQYLGPRTDVDEDECDVAQLKYKPDLAA